MEYGIATPCQMLFEALSRTHVLVSQDVYDILAQARALGGVLTEANVLELREDLPLLLATAVVVERDHAYRHHRYQCVEIEINRHCNFRCNFCPVSQAPKPPDLMSSPLFRLILDRVVEYGAPVISLNHYSEPTLHPRFLEFCGAAAERGLKVRLHSNLSGLDHDKITELHRIGSILQVIVNMPSADPQEFCEITRSSAYARVVQNIEIMASLGFRINLAANMPREEERERLVTINARFNAVVGESSRWDTDDRAGRMQDMERYRLPVLHEGRLTGCELALWQINVSCEGKVFLCCQDFDQEYTVGSLVEQSLRDIVEGPRMVALRRSIFGEDEPSDAFICRRCHRTSSAPTSPVFVLGGKARQELGTSSVAVSGRLLDCADIRSHLES